MYTVYLKRNEENRILSGHLWVFANEVWKIEGKDSQGSIAKVLSFDGRFIGTGYINHMSKIIVRLLSFNDEVIDEKFFKRRIQKAYEFKQSLGYGDNYRVIFGENDMLPGLIVDKYGDYLCAQFLTQGMEVRKQMIIDILVELFSPKGIFERSDVSVREKEGLKQFKGIIYGEVPEYVEIFENGLKLLVDMENGQKTGYFLDQKENRLNLRRYVEGKTVLDCFCNEGGFALNAARGGAKEIIAADISQSALNLARKNAELNDICNISYECADVFELLRTYRKEEKKFDVIVLDPPAFTKSADTVKEGYNGYRDINIQALKLLNEDGILVTNSCSQHFTPKLFLDMISESVCKAKVRAQMVEFRTQARDHSSLIGMEEGLYLKQAVIHILG